jgi:ABC-type transporter Mla subunit MlaD
MTISDNAQQLVQAGEAVERDIRGVLSTIDADLQSIAAKLQQIRTRAEDSTSEAASVLGDAHPQLDSIVGPAAEVAVKVEEVHGLLSQLEIEAGSLGDRGSVLNQAFRQVAGYLMGGM